jgi:exosortase
MTQSPAKPDAARMRAGVFLNALFDDPAARRAALVILVAALPFVILWPTIVSLAQLWSDPLRVELSHGYLTLAISAWLIWFRRRELSQVPTAVNWFAMIALAVLSIAWLVLMRASVQIGHQMLLPIVSIVSVCAVCGWAVTRRTLFPIGYLYLAMPIWTVMNALLQWGSVLAVRGFLRVLGIPAYFSGTTIEVSAGVFEIADGCSGLRLMLVGLAIAILYGEMQRASLGMRLMLVMLAAFLSAFANWLRILLIIGAAHFYGIDHPLVGDHIWFGWVVFAGTMVVFFYIANRLPDGAADSATASSDINATVVPKAWRATLIAAGVIAIAPMWATMQVVLSRYELSQPLAAPQLSGWTQAAAASSWMPKFTGADNELHLVYESRTDSMEFFTASYREQRQGKELAGFGNSVLGEQAGRVIASQRESERGVERVRQTVQSWDGRTWLYWYSYRIGNDWLSKPLNAQLRYGFVSLWRIPESRVVAVRAACSDASNCDAAAKQLQLLWSAIIKAGQD